MTKPQDNDRFLPLRPNWFHILVSLADAERHGYGIMQEVEERTAGEVHLWPATLYNSIKAMVADGLIGAAQRPADDADDDPRRRYYAITELGLEVLRLETRRREALVAGARAKTTVGPTERDA